MSPDEVEFLKKWGLYLLIYVVDSVTWFTCYGMALGILLPTLCILFPSTNARSLRSLGMFVVNVICLTTATIIFASQTKTGWLYIQSPRILAEYDPPKSGIPDFWRMTYASETLSSWMNPFAVVTSDVVVIWRVWHLHGGDHWKKMSLPIVFLLATAITLVLSNAYALTFDAWYKAKFKPQNIGITLGNTGDALSLVTNLVATLLVGLRLWKERQVVTRYIRRRAAFSFGEKILVFLVEFGAIFCLLQILSLFLMMIVEYSRIRSFALWAVTGCVYRFQRAFATVYPTLVIILVRTKKNFMNELDTELFGSRMNTMAQSYQLQNLTTRAADQYPER